MIWFEVSSAFEFAWKLRWAAIRPTSSSVMSTFDPSIMPDISEPAPFSPELAKVGSPDRPVACQLLLPIWRRPAAFEKLTIATWPSGLVSPFE